MSSSPDLYAPIEPYAQGLLDVGDRNQVHWETCGSAAGKPALVLHGGPGSGCRPSHRRQFDPRRYRVVLFDQRGCGRSLPHASDPATDMSVNTTPHLIADIERLRRHLGIERWLIYGESWGSTLALAYAEQHPAHVSEIVLCGVTMTRRRDIEWLYGGVGRLFPEAWRRFRDGAGGGTDLLAAYARLMEDRDPDVREAAAAAWVAWEDAVVSAEPQGAPAPYGSRPPTARLALVRICAHYFSQGAWLDEGQVLRDAGRLAEIPGVLVHGRLDMGSPVAVAEALARAWPAARLVVVDDSGHTGSATMQSEILAALDRFGGAYSG